MNKKIIRIAATVILLLLLLVIIFYPRVKPIFKKGKGSAPSGTMQGAVGQGGQKLLASGYLIEPTQMSELIYTTGTLLPDEEVEMSFETSGKIINIYFTEGTRVRKGDLMAKINDKPLQAQLQRLQVQRKLTADKEFRERQLLERGATSRESYDQIVAEMQVMDADISLTQARIAETEMHAPFDGVVGLRMVSEGFYATTQTKIVRLVKISPLKIEFSISERYAGEVTPGFPITFKVDGVRQTFEAAVYAVDPKIDVNTRMIVVRALYPNSREELKPGRFVSVTAQLSKISNAVSIPTEAVIPEMEGEKVFVFKKGKAEQRRISIGLRTESHVQVRSGLDFGDTLLTTATLQLRPGIPVQLDTLVTDNTPEIREP